MKRKKQKKELIPKTIKPTVINRTKNSKRKKKFDSTKRKQFRKYLEIYADCRDQIKELGLSQDDAKKALMELIKENGMFNADCSEEFIPGYNESQAEDFEVKVVYPEASLKLDHEKAKKFLPKHLLKKVLIQVVDESKLNRLVDEGEITDSMFNNIITRKQNSPRIHVKRKTSNE